MGKQKHVEFMDFIGSRLEDCTQELRKEIPQCLANTERWRKLGEKPDELPLDEKEMSLLKDYLSILFETAAEEPPAFNSNSLFCFYNSYIHFKELIRDIQRTVSVF